MVVIDWSGSTFQISPHRLAAPLLPVDPVSALPSYEPAHNSFFFSLLKKNCFRVLACRGWPKEQFFTSAWIQTRLGRRKGLWGWPKAARSTPVTWRDRSGEKSAVAVSEGVSEGVNKMWRREENELKTHKGVDCCVSVCTKL